MRVRRCVRVKQVLTCIRIRRGASGYGYFNIEDWTQFRLTVLHPAKEPPYPVVKRLGSVARPATNRTNGHVSSKVNGTTH